MCCEFLITRAHPPQFAQTQHKGNVKALFGGRRCVYAINKYSDRSMGVLLPALLENNDRQTERPTDRGIIEVAIWINSDVIFSSLK